jgi:hypothetical protein
LERPKYGTLVAACNNETTLYGNTLAVTAETEDGEATATATWIEVAYDPVTDRARWEAMNLAWRFARGDYPEKRQQRIYDVEHPEDSGWTPLP